MLIYGIFEDVVVLVKVLNDFVKGNDKLVLCVGLYDGKVFDVDVVKVLVMILSCEELFSKLLFVM